MIRRGFTIIEVLVVILIMGIIMGVGSVRFRDFQRRQIVSSAKRTLLGDVRAAQSDATSGRKPEGCTGTLDGYEFEVTNTGGPSTQAKYEINAICQSGSVPIKETTLAPGITITAPSTNPVQFRTLSRGTNLSSDETITIMSSGATNQEILGISVAGIIK